jgi:hypothetical protein
MPSTFTGTSRETAAVADAALAPCPDGVAALAPRPEGGASRTPVHATTRHSTMLAET